MRASSLYDEIRDNQGLKRIFYRMRTFSNQFEDLSPLVVTSAVRGEGKTCVAVILGLVFAHDIKKSCLLVDANWNSPRLHHWFDAEPDKSTSQIISDPVSCINKTSINNLDILCAPGDLEKNTNTDNMENRDGPGPLKEMFNSIARNYDLVIFDCESVLSSQIALIDPMYIASFAKSSVMVVMMRKTDRAKIKRAKFALEDVNSSLSIVLNNVYNPLYNTGGIK